MPNAAGKKAPATAHTINPSEYNAVVASASLQGIQLVNSAFEATPEAFLDTDEDRQYTVNYELLANRYENESGHLSGLFRFAAVGNIDENQLISVEGTYLVDYHVSGTCKNDAAALFVERLGPFAAYPYFRALFGLLTGQSGLVTPPLPILAEAPRSLEHASKVQLKEGRPFKKTLPTKTARPGESPAKRLPVRKTKP